MPEFKMSTWMFKSGRRRNCSPPPNLLKSSLQVEVDLFSKKRMLNLDYHDVTTSMCCFKRPSSATFDVLRENKKFLAQSGRNTRLMFSVTWSFPVVHSLRHSTILNYENVRTSRKLEKDNCKHRDMRGVLRVTRRILCQMWAINEVVGRKLMETKLEMVTVNPISLSHYS